MKKVLAILICTLTLNAHATEMCARDDTVVVPLDATLNGNGTDNGSNQIEWIWWVTFSYGRIYGYSSCLSLQDIRDIENNQKLSSVPDILSSNDTKLLGKRGYYNDDNSVPENERKYCFVQMIHPMLSQWVHTGYHPGAEKTCYDACHRFSASYVNGNHLLRLNIFDSVGK